VLYSDAKPGDIVIADLGYGGVNYNVPVVVASIEEGKSVFGSPVINIHTRCGLDLCFFPGQAFELETSNAEGPQVRAG